MTAPPQKHAKFARGMKARRRLCVGGMVIGGLLLLSPFIGLFGTVVAMMKAFSVLGQGGIADPQALSDSIGTALTSTALGIFFLPVGILVFTLSLVLYLRARSLTPPPLPVAPGF